MMESFNQISGRSEQFDGRNEQIPRNYTLMEQSVR